MLKMLHVLLTRVPVSEQIRPVGGTPFYSSMMNCDPALLSTKYADYDPNIRTEQANQLLPEARGIALMKQMKLCRLDSQQRSLDPKHTSNIQQLSTVDPSFFSITDKLLDCYPAISPDEIAADPEWYNAAIVVANNDIRHKINQIRIISHAKTNGRPVIFWRNTPCGDNASLLSRAELQRLYSTHLPLTSYFAVGGLCMITENLSQAKGIVNGTQCVMHSLTPDPKEDEERAKRRNPLDNTPFLSLHDAIRNAKPGEMVELLLPPLSINVTISPESSTLQNVSASDTLVQGQHVIPMFESTFSKTEPIKSWELLGREHDPIQSIAFKDHCLELRYSITFHKIQVQSAQNFHCLLLD